MKSIIIISLFAFFVGNTVAFAQSKAAVKNSELAGVQMATATDSIYYSCVPCCEPCSVYTTDKAGECPHCGMTLQKRKYKADAKTNTATAPHNSTCKPPKEKKKSK